MKNKVLIALVFLLVNFAEAQVCRHLSLSNTFEFNIEFKRIIKEEASDSCFINLEIIDKKSKRAQKVTVFSESIFSSDYKDCAAVKSFSTGINTNIPVSDNGSGDFIVIDLNFDGLEDFAILSDSGGNGGPIYSFYIQNKKGKFTKDTYLTETMEFFPLQINRIKKRLTIYVHASAYDLRKTTFGYNVKTKKWKIVDNVLVGYDDCPTTIEIK